MADEVTISSFSTELQALLKEYGREVQEVVNEEVEAVAKDALKKVKDKSPKKTGKYKKGWKLKVSKYISSCEATIYNDAKPGLVHLLEHGHLKADGTDRTEKYPHVGPAQDWAEVEVVRRVKAKL